MVLDQKNRNLVDLKGIPVVSSEANKYKVRFVKRLENSSNYGNFNGNTMIRGFSGLSTDIAVLACLFHPNESRM